MDNPKLTFLGGVGKTIGANFLVDFSGVKLLVDCGLFQGFRDADERNAADFKYDPAEIKFLFVTHAHMDHIGRIPKLIKDGFGGRIISTPETKEIAEHLLFDAYKIMTSRERGGVSRNFYEEKHIKEALDLWETKKYGEDFQIANEISVCLRDAGHILGSAMVEMKFREKGEGKIKVVFTGDLGNSPAPLLRDTEEINGADYIIMESVYGDRNHENKAERREKFKKIINEAIKRGGEIIIPAFSVDRTQIILYELNNLVEDGEIPSVPVFLDSPLGEKVTEIYKKSAELFNENIRKEIAGGDNIFDFPKLKIINSFKESQKIEDAPNPKIIIAGSGMSEGGRVLEHEAKSLPHPENTVLLMGYQPIGTLGRELQDGAEEVEIKTDLTPSPSPFEGEGRRERKHSSQKIKVKARIEKIEGYSAHKDSERLLEFVEKSNKDHKLTKVFVTMGEPKASLFLTQRIRDYLDIDAVYPEEGREYELV